MADLGEQSSSSNLETSETLDRGEASIPPVNSPPISEKASSSATFALTDLYGQSPSPDAQSDLPTTETSPFDNQPSLSSSETQKTELANQYLMDLLIELKLNQSEDEVLIKEIQADLDQHLEIIDRYNPRQELLNLISAHLFKDICKTIGVSDLTAQLDQQKLIDALQNNYQPAILPTEELALLSQINQENITPQRLALLLAKTLQINNDANGQEQWTRIQESYRQHYSSDNLNKINRYLKMIIEINEKIAQTKSVSSANAEQQAA